MSSSYQKRALDIGRLPLFPTLLVLFLSLSLSFHVEGYTNKNIRMAIKRTTEPQLPLPYVMNAATCDVCLEVSRQVLRQVDIYKELTNVSMIPRYEVDSILEHICDPYSLYGAWIRQLRFYLGVDESSSTSVDIYNENVTVYFNTKMEETVTKCHRVCGTVQHSCERIVDNVKFSSYSKTIAMLSQEPGPAATLGHLDLLNETFCQQFVECYARPKVMKNCNIALNDFKRSEKPRHQILEDIVETLPVEEFETDFRLFNNMRSKEFSDGFQEKELRKLKKMAKKDLSRSAEDFARRKAAASRRLLSKANITSKAYAMEFLLPNITNNTSTDSKEPHFTNDL